MRLSCIIPVKDGAAYLGASLDSIAHQTRRPDEVILVDDGSSDHSSVIAAAHALRPRLLRLTGLGVAAARNAGIAAAQGELLAFLDADDLWRPDKLARQLARFDRRSDLDLSLGDVENFADPPFSSDDWRLALIGRDARTMLLSSTVVTKRLVDRIGGFDETLKPWGEDTDWFLRAIAAGAVLERDNAVLVDRRLHQSNLTRDFSPQHRRDLAFTLLARHRRRRQVEALPRRELTIAGT